MGRAESSRAEAPRTVRLYLEEGRAHGLTIAEIGNWSGRVIAAPRSSLQRLLARPECERTGVYILLGADPETSGRQLAYIGEADEIGKRLRRHMATGDNDFFEHVAFVVGGESLTKAHARYLEAQLIRATTEASGVRLFNHNHPDFRRLPEADLADMETFLENLRLVLPLVGFDLYSAPPGAEPARAPVDTEARFVFATAGARAVGRDTEDGFVVLRGSTARKGASATFPPGHSALREQLIGTGRLIDDTADGLYRFASDVVFSSPSAAAAIVAARSASGPLEWKLEGTGETYRDWTSARLDQASGVEK